MAVSGRYYHLSFKNADVIWANNPEPTVHIRIYDLTLEDETTIAHEIIEIEGSGDPFHTSTVDNSEDKFTGVKPIQATIKFLSSNQVKLSSFVNAPIPLGGIDVGDPRWYVEAYLNAYLPENFIFKGFLNLDDCSEAFLPEKNEVTLIANDGLGGLKNIPLTNFNSSNPIGYNRIADYLAWALSKTGLRLKLNAVFNIREKEKSSQHFFDAMHLHAKTFEDKIGACINCYDVIEKILGEQAFLTQRDGEWWIVRVDEAANLTPYYVAVFDSEGAFVSISDGDVYEKHIASNLPVFFSQDSTTVHPIRPNKFIKENYKFEYPQEIVDNIDFSRGEPNLTLAIPPVTIDGVTYYQRKYAVDDWLLQRIDGGVSEINTYIRRLFLDANNTYEKERVIVFEAGQTNSGFPNTHQHRLLSHAIPVGKSDKIDFSVDRRLPIKYGGTKKDVFELFAQIKLVGEDGSVWWFQQFNDISTRLSGQWQSNQYQGVGVVYNLTDVKDNDWQTASVTTTPVPVSGNLFIYLLAPYLVDPYKAPEAHFTNLQLGYIPFINGDYSKYLSSYYKISKPENYVNNRDKQVYVSDSPKKLFKGSLFKQGIFQSFLTCQTGFITTVFDTTQIRIVPAVSVGDVRALFPKGSKFQISGTTNNNGVFTVKSANYISGGNTVIETVETLIAEAFPSTTFSSPNYVLTNQFYAWNDIHTLTPDDIYVHPYAHLQAYDIWNQFRNGCVKFQAALQGLSNNTIDSNNYIDHPHLIHRYFLDDTNENTNDRIFMLLTFDMDWYSCEWKGTLIEVYNLVNGKSYLDTLEIKYEQ